MKRSALLIKPVKAITNCRTFRGELVVGVKARLFDLQRKDQGTEGLFWYQKTDLAKMVADELKVRFVMYQLQHKLADATDNEQV